MADPAVFQAIKSAIYNSPRNAFTAELHLQVIKYASELEDVKGREFCEYLGLTAPWGSEFLKMMKIAPRLRDAGLDPNRL